MSEFDRRGERGNSEPAGGAVAERAPSVGAGLPSGLLARKIARRAAARQQGADANGVQANAPEAVAAASSGGGSALPKDLQKKFEKSTGKDLSGVRVHTGDKSKQAAASVGAKAYTMGQDIHFGDGHYDPSSKEGEHLLAHEVAHTVQQSGGSAQGVQHKLEVSSPGDSHEHEADKAADAMVSGTSTSVAGGGPSGIHRKKDETSSSGSDVAKPKAWAPPPGASKGIGFSQLDGFDMGNFGDAVEDLFTSVVDAQTWEGFEDLRDKLAPEKFATPEKLGNALAGEYVHVPAFESTMYRYTFKLKVKAVVTSIRSLSAAQQDEVQISKGATSTANSGKSSDAKAGGEQSIGGHAGEKDASGVDGSIKSTQEKSSGASSQDGVQATVQSSATGTVKFKVVLSWSADLTIDRERTKIGWAAGLAGMPLGLVGAVGATAAIGVGDYPRTVGTAGVKSKALIRFPAGNCKPLDTEEPTSVLAGASAYSYGVHSG